MERMTTWRMGQRYLGPTDLLVAGTDGTGDLDAGLSVDDGRMHEALVCVRLTSSTPGSRLLDFLRTEPCAVDAWWIAADIDAVVRLASPSRRLLHRAVGDLRRRAGAEVVAMHTILRPLDLSPDRETPAEVLTR